MAWWFGRKSAPEPVRPLVPSWLSASGGEGFARSYEAQFDEVYRNNPIGQRAVRLVSGLVGSLTVYAADGEEAGAKLVGSELLESIAAALLAGRASLPLSNRPSPFLTHSSRNQLLSALRFHGLLASS